MRRILKTLILLLVGGIVGAAIALFAVVQGLKNVPQFYAEALTVAPEAHELAGDELEKRVFQFSEKSNV